MYQYTVEKTRSSYAAALIRRSKISEYGYLNYAYTGFECIFLDKSHKTAVILIPFED